MKPTRPAQINDLHLARLAVVYLRQSSPKQVAENVGSTAHQRDQRVYARQWGWPDDAIMEIDQDLGLSGTSAEHREGFQRLLKMVERREVGVILVSDPSRLTRSSRDFELLLALCRATDTLLAVEGAIVDLNNYTDRLLAKIQASIAEYDNDQRIARFTAAKLTKARAGHAVSVPPTGYVVTRKGQWAKDPDRSVREAIEEVIRQFQALGTAGKVLQFFHDHGLQLPIRRSTGELRWTRPNRARIYEILNHPAFKGCYCFGRRKLLKAGPPRRHLRTSEEYWIMVPNHHEPYISPAEWHKIRERLHSNQFIVRAPAGTGPALCQGLVRCGRCGRRMLTQYQPRQRNTSIAYVCLLAHHHYKEPRCWSIHGQRLDALVTQELLGLLRPPELDAVLRAAGQINEGYDACRRQREAELERARYEAALAERRYKQVDPDCRLVAATLAGEWDQAKQKLQRLEHRFAEEPLTPPLQVTAEILQAIRRLAEDLPGLWSAPSTTDQERKQLVRIFIQEIRVVSSSRIDFQVEFLWVGGTVTQHSLFRPWAGGILARELAAQGLSLAEIAAELNRRGITKQEHRSPYTAKGIRDFLQQAKRRGRMPDHKRFRQAATNPTAPE